MPDGTVFYHKVYDGGNNEAFIFHVKEVIKLAERKNYFDYYEGAVFKKSECLQRFNKAQKKSDDAVKDPTLTVDRLKALEKSLELATQQVMEAKLPPLKRGRPFLDSTKPCWEKLHE